MDESTPQDTIERVKKLVNFLSKNTDKNIEIIVVGGTAMSFYGDYRTTMDIDAEIINCPENLYKNLLEHLKENKIQFNIDEDFDSWGMVPMPLGYRERAIPVYNEGNITVKTLEPIDFIISKLRRGADIDINDAEKIVSRNNITEKAIRERASKIEFIKTEETFWFKQRLEMFINEKIKLKQDLSQKTEPKLKPETQSPKPDAFTESLQNKHKIKFRR